MAFWNRDDEGEWEKYQKSKGKTDREPEEGKTPPASDEFRSYFKAVRQAQSPESGEAGQPGETTSPLQIFLSRFRGGEKPKETGEPEGPPEKCPWCGGYMIKGYLRGGRDGVRWYREKPKFLTIPSTSVDMLNEGNLWTYKTVWHCEKCHKMVLDTLLLDPPLGVGNSTPSALSYDEQVSAAMTEGEDTPPENNKEEE